MKENSQEYQQKQEQNQIQIIQEEMRKEDNVISAGSIPKSFVSTIFSVLHRRSEAVDHVIFT